MTPQPPAPPTPTFPFHDDHLRAILRLAEAGYPEEVCGLVLGPRDDPGAAVVRPLRNVAGDDPFPGARGGPQDRRSAYLMDPLEQLQVVREADARGWDVLAIYHSHPDHPATFSATDEAWAVDQARQPLWPGTLYLVVSVCAGRAVTARAYRWSDTERTFHGSPVVLPAPG